MSFVATLIEKFFRWLDSVDTFEAKCPTCGAKRDKNKEQIGFDLDDKVYECGYHSRRTGQFGENVEVVKECGAKKA